MTSSNVNTHFCKVKLQRRSRAMKLILYTCIVCPTQVLRCFLLDTITLIMFLFVFSFFFLSLFTDISLRQIVSTFYETEYLTIFFVYLLICTSVHICTCKDICIHDSFFFPQYNLCIVPQQKYPQIPSQTTTTLPNPHYNTQLLYIMSICITHTRTHTQQNQNRKKKRKKKLQTDFWKGLSLCFPSAIKRKKERGRGVGR